MTAELGRKSARNVWTVDRKTGHRLLGGPIPLYVKSTRIEIIYKTLMLVSDMTFFLNHIRYEFVLVTENWLEPLNKTVNGQFSYLWNDVCIFTY